MLRASALDQRVEAEYRKFTFRERDWSISPLDWKLADAIPA
jgi:hypothetical protein